MRRLILSLLLVVMACGPAQAKQPASTVTTPSAAATAASNPSPGATANSGPLLFAALEAKIPGSPYEWNTVAIAGLDGHARARTTFMPMPVPTIGCAGASLPPSAHVAGGKVYFADGAGVVRTLSVNGQVALVARFPFNGHQQMLSFAVSPDGSQLLGTVFTLPAKPSWCGPDQAVSGYSLDVYSAKAGGSSTLLYHESLSATDSILALFGWDNLGPFGTSPTGWASQGGGPAPYGRGSPVRIDPTTGRVLSQIGSTGCEVWDMALTGDYACLTNSAGTDDQVTARHASGSEMWHSTLSTEDGFSYDPQLAPDEAHVSVGINAATAVVGRSGGQIKIGMYPGGWLDSNTLIGGLIDPLSPNPDLAYAALSAPSRVISLGFAGLFLGSVNR